MIWAYKFQVMEIQDTEISNVKSDIKLMIEQNNNQLSSVRSQLSSSEEAVRVMGQTLATQTEAVISLQSKVSDQEDVALVSDITVSIQAWQVKLLLIILRRDYKFSILTLSISNAINKGPLDPFGTHQDLESARASHDKAQQKLSSAVERKYELEQQRNELEQKLARGRALEMKLPQLQSDATTIESRSIMLQRQFGLLKDTSSMLLLKVKHIRGEADVAEKTVLLKKEFGLALLHICNDAMIDPHLVDEVHKVRTEIITGWDGKMLDEIEEVAAEIDGKISLLGNLPSIEERL